MVINTNIQAQVAASNLQTNQALLGKSLARLSSGSKIVEPSDDAAGMAVSNRLDAQINRTAAAKANVANAISFTQTQDGYLKKVAKALDRMSELAILAQDVTKTDTDRDLYQTEFSQLALFITNTATKDFNGVKLFSANALEVTIDSDGNTFSMAGTDLANTAYTDVTGTFDPVTGAITGTGVSVGSSTGVPPGDPAAALTKVKAAIQQLATDRASIGAYQTRLASTSEQLVLIKENLNAASSRIRDVDIAEESTQYARENILVQSGTAMLAQANQLPQSVLRLLQ